MVLVRPTGSREPFLDGHLSPVVRFGMVVAAMRPGGERVCLTYDDADQIIKYIVRNGNALSERLADTFVDDLAQRNLGHVSTVDRRTIDALRLESSAEISVPGTVTGANLPEFILNIRGKLVLVRTSFTICVDDDQFGLMSSEPLRMHSKIWARMILIADDNNPSLQKCWSHDDTTGFYHSVLAIRDVFEGQMRSTYEEFISQCTSGRLNIASVHRITLATFGASRASFNEILKDVPKGELLGFRSAPHWPGCGELAPGATQNSLLSFADLFLNNLVPGSIGGLAATVDVLRGEHGESPFYKIVSVDDGAGSRGVFLAEISNESSNFVGIAADQDIEFSPPAETALFDDEDGVVLDRVRVARVPSNVVTTILSVDIATGL